MINSTNSKADTSTPPEGYYPPDIANYIRIPRVSPFWLLLAVLFLLVGVTVWAVVGTIPLTYETTAYMHNGTLLCCVPEGDMDTSPVDVGMSVRIGTDKTGTVSQVNQDPVSGTDFINGIESEYVKQKLTVGDWNYIAQIATNAPLKEGGVYAVSIDTEDVNPFTYYFG